MSAIACPECGAWMRYPTPAVEEIGLQPVRLQWHRRGKVKTADRCPASGREVRYLATGCPRCGKGTRQHDYDCLDGPS